jgi:hypothetical protein|nr:MAG TPA: 4Fe-4S single cluster domain protein [Caudoviricetes sp.]
MKVKGIETERFQDYKKPCLFIATCQCTWKCCIDGGFDNNVCQNSDLAKMQNKEIGIETIYDYYISNPITKSVVLGGLEPILQFDEVLDLIKYFRTHGCEDDFVIYTGYKKNEIYYEIDQLKQFKNIIVKFGRYVPGQEKHFDPVLGVELASNNQYAERIS